jgi:hypothetical protein
LYKQSVNLSKAVILNKSAKNKSKSSTGNSSKQKWPYKTGDLLKEVQFK